MRFMSDTHNKEQFQSAASNVSTESKKSINANVPAVAQQKSVGSADIDSSPRQMAEAQKIKSLFSSPVQRQEEEELQGKFPIQRQEEEELQGKFPVQRQEEEELQGKFPIQRQEEEELQGKFPIQRQEEDELQGKFPIQRQEEDESGGLQSSGGNTGIPDNVQAKMESALNTSFSDVKVHANSSKATDVGALAYTQGTDVHFAPGQYSPGTSSGQKLLGHELTHVVQQSEGRVEPTGEVAGMPLNDNPALEKEADILGAKAV